LRVIHAIGWPHCDSLLLRDVGRWQRINRLPPQVTAQLHGAALTLRFEAALQHY
jgi:hypothetical protein